eukprot:1036907-Pleurochrysis_carterae.AAC.1
MSPLLVPQQSTSRVDLVDRPLPSTRACYLPLSHSIQIRHFRMPHHICKCKLPLLHKLSQCLCAHPQRRAPRGRLRVGKLLRLVEANELGRAAAVQQALIRAWRGCVDKYDEIAADKAAFAKILRVSTKFETRPPLVPLAEAEVSGT